jgi:type IX secretion system PorP/SprF family membrane protein
MKNKYVALIICMLMLCFSWKSKAQDMHFTQFFSSPLYLNPAFAGANVCSRVSLTYRNQWPGVSKAYRSFLASGDHYLQQKHLGIGLLIGNDVAGTGELKTTIVDPMLAYDAKLNRKLFLRVGVQPGLTFRSINFNKLVFGDQIARGGDVPSVEDPTENKMYFDIGAGALLYSKKYWGGVSFYHLNKPDEALTTFGETAVNPMRFTIHGGAKFKLNPADEKEDKDQRSISPAFHYRQQNKFSQFDMGLYFTKYVFNVGIWYRGIPLFKAYKPGYANNDAIAIIIGVTNPRFNFGYSYDATISKLANVSHGAHEICISYQLCKLKKKTRYRLLVPCPKF